MKFLKTLTVLLVAVMIPIAALAGGYKTTPLTNDGARWRVGYYQGGDYEDYSSVLITTIEGLMDLGWIPEEKVPFTHEDPPEKVWAWASKLNSSYIVFMKDAFYTAHWEPGERESLRNKVVGRLRMKADVDMMLAAGTWGGKDLANNQHKTPILILTASDPVAAGIVRDAHHSGYEHVWAHTTPKRYQRQIELFYDIFKFKKLGIVYEDTRDGRSYSAIDTVALQSRMLGFSIVRCFSISDISDVAARHKSALDCFAAIIDKVDALYITTQGGVSDETVPDIVKLANKRNVPTFSQNGADEVKLGVLLSMSHSDFKYDGEFYAETIAKVFNGAKPGDLDQAFEGPPKLAINLKTAKAIGFKPPLLLLGAADEVISE